MSKPEGDNLKYAKGYPNIINNNKEEISYANAAKIAEKVAEGKITKEQSPAKIIKEVKEKTKAAKMKNPTRIRRKLRQRQRKAKVNRQQPATTPRSRNHRHKSSTRET